MMKYTMSPPASDFILPKSTMSTMFWCWMSLTAFASLKKRWTMSSLAASSSSNTLTATRLPMSGCSPR